MLGNPNTYYRIQRGEKAWSCRMRLIVDFVVSQGTANFDLLVSVQWDRSGSATSFTPESCHGLAAVKVHF